MIPTVDTIQRAAEILRQIEALSAELADLVGGVGSPAKTAPKRRGRPPGSGKAKEAAQAPVGIKRRHHMSSEGRARIAAASKARWARFHAAQKKAEKV